MVVVINGEKISLDSSYLKNNKIGFGSEGVVYKFGDYALKLYYDNPRKNILDTDTINYLSTIETDRILLPIDGAFSEQGDLLGYLTQYHNTNKLKGIKNMDISTFIDEVEKIENDALYLEESRVDIDDLHRENIVFDGSINLVDPGSYMISDNFYINNSEKVEEFVLEEIIYPIAISMFNSKKANNLLNDISNNTNQSISQFVKDTSSSFDTVKSYVKRMGK